jgi:hypothetical protein
MTKHLCKLKAEKERVPLDQKDIAEDVPCVNKDNIARGQRILSQTT